MNKYFIAFGLVFLSQAMAKNDSPKVKFRCNLDSSEINFIFDFDRKTVQINGDLILSKNKESTQLVAVTKKSFIVTHHQESENALSIFEFTYPKKENTIFLVNLKKIPFLEKNDVLLKSKLFICNSNIKEL
jgi:hypothetical protein